MCQNLCERGARATRFQPTPSNRQSARGWTDAAWRGCEATRGGESCVAARPGADLYYRWTKEFREAGKKRLLGDTTREGTAPEVQGLRDENTRLKQALHDDLRRHGPVHLGNVGLTACAAHRVLIAIDGKLSIPRDPNRRALRGP